MPKKKKGYNPFAKGGDKKKAKGAGKKLKGFAAKMAEAQAKKK